MIIILIIAAIMVAVIIIKVLIAIIIAIVVIVIRRTPWSRACQIPGIFALSFCFLASELAQKL